MPGDFIIFFYVECSKFGDDANWTNCTFGLYPSSGVSKKLRN
jgi:hypothetical protein